MLKSICISALVLFAVTLQAQNFKKLETIKLEELAQYQEHNTTALKCADFLLNTEVNEEKANRARATQFIMRWMTGIDISYELGEDFLKYGDDNTDRTTVYLASLVYASLQNPDVKMDAKEINKKGELVFLDYCENFKAMKKNKAIKKALKERSE